MQQELRETKGMLEQLDVKISCLGKDLVVLGSNVRTVMAAMKELFPVAFKVKPGCPATVDGLPSNAYTSSDDLIPGPYDSLGNAFAYPNPFSQDNSDMFLPHILPGQYNNANAIYDNLFANSTAPDEMPVPSHPPSCPTRSSPRLRTVPKQASSFDEACTPYALDACDVPPRSFVSSAGDPAAPERLALQPRPIANRRKASLPFCPELSRKVVGSRRVSHSTTDILTQTRQMGGGSAVGLSSFSRTGGGGGGGGAVYSENRVGLKPAFDGVGLRSVALDNNQPRNDWNPDAKFSTTDSNPPLKFLTTDL